MKASDWFASIPAVLRDVVCVGSEPDSPAPDSDQVVQRSHIMIAAERLVLIGAAAIRDNSRNLKENDKYLNRAWHEVLTNFSLKTTLKYIESASASELLSEFSPFVAHYLAMYDKWGNKPMGITGAIRKRYNIDEYIPFFCEELSFLNDCSISGSSTPPKLPVNVEEADDFFYDDESSGLHRSVGEHRVPFIREHYQQGPFLHSIRSESFNLAPLLKLHDDGCGCVRLFSLREIKRSKWVYHHDVGSTMDQIDIVVPRLTEAIFLADRNETTLAMSYLIETWENSQKSDTDQGLCLKALLSTIEQMLRRDKRDEALKAIEEGLRAFPRQPKLIFLRAHCYFKAEKFKATIDTLKPLIEPGPAPAAALRLTGRSYTKLGEHDSAVEWFEKAVQRLPDDNTLQTELKNAKARQTKQKRREGSSPSVPAKQEEKQFSLEKYVDNLTERVTKRPPLPLPGREDELDRLVEILSCNHKRNVLLTGEPGVGKSSLIVELARRMAEGVYGNRWQQRKIIQLNVAALVAGARFRGQYEERLLELVDHLKGAPEYLLVIDDIHTFFNTATNKSGGIDPSHIFKPSLADGSIQMIGMTSNDHYRVALANDTAVQRSFTKITLEEPTERSLRDMVPRIVRQLEGFHRVTISPEAAKSAEDMSELFLRDRAQPDKLEGILDAACVLAKIEEDGLGRNRLDRDEEPRVTTAHVVRATANRSGIPEEKIARRNFDRFLQMEEKLSSVVIGQDHAVSSVARILRVARTKLQLKSHQPDGVFLFAGPTGVGKTELALALADFLFGSREKLIRIDMSEYMEHIATSKLIGIAPGYVGYHDRTQLTDRVRQEPYSLVLLDEIEKANPQVLNLFLQVFDTGRLTDSKGNTVHFDNTVFVMTSNLGTDLYGRSIVGYGTGSGQLATKQEMNRALKQHLTPEFINRIDDIVFFHPLGANDMQRILDLNLKSLQERVGHEYGVKLEFDELARQTLVERGFSKEFGARELQRTIRRLLLDPLAQVLMESPGLGLAAGKPTRIIRVQGRDLETSEAKVTQEDEVLEDELSALHIEAVDGLQG